MLYFDTGFLAPLILDQSTSTAVERFMGGGKNRMRQPGRQRAGRAALVIALLLSALPALAADNKPWRHGIIEPKSDAGILTMIKNGGFAEKQGLALELVNIQSDQIGLKALLAGDLDSYEGGPAGVLVADSRGADAKIIGCHWPVLPHGIFTRGNKIGRAHV